MGMRFYVDDASAFSQPFGSGRSISLGFGTGPTTRMLASGCEFYFGVDQTFNIGAGFGSSATNEVGIFECLIGYSLYDSIHEISDGDPGSGFEPHSCGGFIDHTIDKFSMQRCFLPHNASRNLHSSARINTVCNNLFHNWGKGGGSQGFYILNHSSDANPQPIRLLFAKNLSVKGPDAFGRPITGENDVLVATAAISLVW